MRISGYWEKIPFSVLQLHILIYNSFYGLCIDTWLNESSLLILNFSFIAFVLRWKANLLIKELIVSFLMIFLYVTIFIWEVRFTCFPKWFEITINTKFLKVLQFGLFFQIGQQVSLSLKLDYVTRIFWHVFETWSDHYLLPKGLIKMGFLIPS